jgi:predicted dehydrogenase
MANIGIIGCGRIIPKHIEAISYNSKKYKINLVSVCDKDIDKALFYAKKIGINAYSNMHLMLKQENLDLIVILTESGNHIKHILELAKYKKIFIVEKPLSLNFKDCIKLKKICKKYNSKIFVVKQNRFNQAIIKLKEYVNKNKLGKLFLGSVKVRWCRKQDYYNLSSWRGTYLLDGGVIGNQASHHIDMLLWMMGEVKSVYAQGINAGVKIESFDTVIVNIKFKNGSLGVIEATVATRPKDLEGSISILGTKGTVVVGGFAMNKINEWSFDNPKNNIKNINKYNTKPKNVYGFGHKAFYSYVLKCLKKDKRKYFIYPENAFEVVKVISAIIKSAKSSKEINL